MSIKMRLLLSYIAMTFIPVVLFALIAGTLASLLLKDMAGNHRGLPAFWQMSSQRDELFAGVKFMAQTDPERFNNSEFLRNTDERLNRLKAGLVVVKNDGVSFASPFMDITGHTDLYRQLHNINSDWNLHGFGPTIYDRFTVGKYDFTFGDHSPGTVYLLSDTTEFTAGLRTFFPIMILSLLLVIALTNGVLTYLVSRSIIKPLQALKHAAERIKDGDLDHEVNLKRKDELGQLGGAFEEMRFRLNESIRLQLQYEENRKELISNISHDLKTPITGIKACIEGIRDGIADSGARREKYINMISKKTEEMDCLIDELFLFSKLDLNRLPFNLEPTDLAAYLRDCAEELRLDPRMDGITVTFSFAGNVPVPVLADREKLRRVIMNIIDNSLKYMEKAPKEIRLELFDDPNEATVKMQDNGPGIEAAALPHIFDRFYRAEPSRNMATGGSGLGLAIVKQIVEGQGGRVWAESRPGEGTSIYFTLQKIKHGGKRS